MNYEEPYKVYLEILKKFPKDYGIVGFIELNKLSLASISRTALPKKIDPYINKEGWFKLKNSLLNKGTYWVFVICKDYDIPILPDFKHKKGLIIHEGFHRFVAFKELISEGKLPKDFKVLCLYFPQGSYETHPKSDYHSKLMDICSIYRDKNIEQLITPHKEINEPNLYFPILNID